MNDPKNPSETSPDEPGAEESVDSPAGPVPTSPYRPVEPEGAQRSAESSPDSASEGGSGSGQADPPPPAGNGSDGDGGDGEEDAELGGRMTFLEHLDELRRRIMYSIISVLVTFVGGWIFREEIYGFLSAPIFSVVERLVVIKPTEPFTIYLKVSFVAAIFFAAPAILVQVWLFIAPGLYRKEKRFAFPFLFSSTVLFVLGGAFAYYVVLPPALNFLLNEFGREFQPMITAMDYFDFVLLIVVGMGVIFQLPVLVAFLSMFGLVTPGFLWRNFRYAFLIITVVAALVSPTTDPFNLFLWSGPMVVLYTFSIAIAWIFQRRRHKQSLLDERRG